MPTTTTNDRARYNAIRDRLLSQITDLTPGDQLLALIHTANAVAERASRTDATTAAWMVTNAARHFASETARIAFRQRKKEADEAQRALLADLIDSN